MTHSESLSALAPALVAAQAEMEHAHKTKMNPHFKNRYADLAEVLDTVSPVLAKHGLAVVQLPGMDEYGVTLETMLVHKSGEWIRGRSGSPLPKADPQGVGSAITYLRRYSLAALCGITQDDDDGNEASKRQQASDLPEPVRKYTPESETKPASDAQMQTLERLQKSSLITQEERDGLLKARGTHPRMRKVAEQIDWLITTIKEREKQPVTA